MQCQEPLFWALNTQKYTPPQLLLADDKYKKPLFIETGNCNYYYCLDMKMILPKWIMPWSMSTCTRAFIREEIKYSEKNLTNRMPRRTETPFKFSAKRSTKEANTMTRSKTFHPLWKYSFDIPNNLRTASVVKNVVNTLLPTSRVCLSSSLMPWCSAAKSRNRT